MPSYRTASKGQLFVLSGPSGSGKDLVLHELLNAPNALPMLKRCVTATSRPRRSSERDGVDYHFLSSEVFQQRVDGGWFIEHETFAENAYGTPVSALKELDEGIDLILKIEVRGALRIRALMPKAVLVFLAPPSLDVLKQRLMLRRTETDTGIELRLARAADEMTYAERYDYLVINDTIGAAVDAVRAIVLAHRHRIGAA